MVETRYFLVISCMLLACSNVAFSVENRSPRKNPQPSYCDNCRCLGQRGRSYNDPQIKALLSKVRYTIFASKRPTESKHICMISESKFVANGDFMYKYGRTRLDRKDGCTPLPKTGARLAYCVPGVRPESNTLRSNAIEDNRQQLNSSTLDEILKGTGDHSYEGIMGTRSFFSSIPWTDGTTLIVTFCFGDKSETAFAVKSLEHKISKETKRVVLDELNKLGFDLSIPKRYRPSNGCN